MPEPRICHLPNITALFRTGLNRLGLVETRRQGTDIVATDMTELGGGR